MIIYGALLIPLIAIIALYYFYEHKIIWWEFFVPLVCSLFFIVSMKLIIETVQVRSEEYWGSFIEKVEYYEDWNEYVHRTCTRTVTIGKTSHTETYDCSYVEYHPPIWNIITTTKEEITISNVQYNEIKKRFSNEQFIELKRNYHTKDGDKYFCKWNKDSANAIPVTTSHSYENRIKVADQSVFHFGEVNEEDIKKYSIKDYPKITENYKMISVIGDNSLDAQLADKKFQYINGLLGHSKQVRIFVLIFYDQPINAGLYQEWYWSGANMNEFVVCIGVDKDRNVKWCKPISWTKNEELKTNIKNFVQNQNKLNLQLLADFTLKNINKQFVRRNFEEFNYLTVEPPTWAVILTYIFTILMNVGLGYWIVKNDYQ